MLGQGFQNGASKLMFQKERQKAFVDWGQNHITQSIITKVC
ncbi:hypothetical protein B739_0211 [Riemerella anatipestifer RA-CH-1]|uniref:Uncharacterized protein n=2 Tax=Riemerella anatipestifer TaxID=34085 RepID=J9R345_RIEAN|nr:hypothetical protein B739_0211 [Riemerella anatipestifer RA-CH-1]AIH01818.1 hypothetical protein M949_0647 [Riemerella anatipestifer CH3]AQY22504.1 hypothetical protein AB406_1560 [Riemerella anatipestifer]